MPAATAIRISPATVTASPIWKAELPDVLAASVSETFSLSDASCAVERLNPSAEFKVLLSVPEDEAGAAACVILLCSFGALPVSLSDCSALSESLLLFLSFPVPLCKEALPDVWLPVLLC